MDVVEHSKYQLGYNRESSPTFTPEIAKWSVNIDILAGKDYQDNQHFTAETS